MIKVTTPRTPQNYFSLEDKLMGTSYLVMPPTTLNSESSGEEYVFHYTTPFGLQNILESGCFYFTDINFLNDKSEMLCALEVFESLLSNKEYIDNLHNDMISELKETYFDYKNKNKNINRFFIFSTSSDSDSLSMWKYYSKNKNYEGYNISFMPFLFQTILEYQNFKPLYGKVLYDYRELESRYKEILDSCNVFWLEHYDTFSHYQIINYIVVKVYQLSLFLKDPHFSDEHEYRFVITRDIDRIDDLKFRVIDGCLIPYIEVKHRYANYHDIIHDITIGPLQNKELCRDSLSLLLRKLQFKATINIVPSTVPVRY